LKSFGEVAKTKSLLASIPQGRDPRAFFMTLIQLYKHTAKNAPYIAIRRKAEYDQQLRELRVEYSKANEIRKPEIEKEAGKLKSYTKNLT